MSDDVPEQYRPRLCHVVKWNDFQGYGFNLHAEKGKAGQFIGKVDENSPAAAAGLKEGDRIVEVNGINIGNENHQQVVTRIKSGGEETQLLVVDSEADNWFKENKKIIRGDLPEVRYISAKRDYEEDEPTLTDNEQVNYDHEERHEERYEERHEESHPGYEETIAETTVSHVSAAAHNGNSEDFSYRPRLCHLKIWPHFQGYGFNLHAERDKPGQYIGLVDDNSPSSTGGLKVQDRIIEVNGVNVEQEKHTEVIARIKAIPGETRLLVVDKETDNYYKEKGVTVSSGMPQTEHIHTPDAADLPAQMEEQEVEKAEINPYAAPVIDSSPVVDAALLINDVESEKNYEGEDAQEIENTQEKEDHRELEEETTEQVEVEHKYVEQQLSVASLADEEKDNEQSEDTVNGLKPSALVTALESKYEHEFTVAPPVRQEQAVASAPSRETGGLELNLSVAEMKERLKAKKRQDPRLNKVSFEQKYKEFQRM